MLWVSTKDLLGLLLLVWAVDVLDGDDGEVAVVSEVAQGDAGAGLDALGVYCLLRHVEGDGYAEEGAICEAVVDDNAGRGSVPLSMLSNFGI